ncbi:MAG: hypothetical protein J0H99_21310, partial [Rhodospirillales bacterium]|nr:hypothetical protein [Rhodospirillales bacterium]
APVTPDQVRLAAKTAYDQIVPALDKLPADHILANLAADLKRVSEASDQVVIGLDRALTRFLPVQLEALRTALGAQPVTLKDVPPEIARDWLLPDGRARVQAVPKAAAQSPAGLREFVAEVRAVAPDAGGSAVTIEATSNTIVNAFRTAAIAALVAITIILFIALRHVLDVALVLAPLLLSGLLTVVVIVSAYLLRDELASGRHGGARLRDGAGDPVLGVDHRDRVRLPGALAASRHGEHGDAAADQPGLHAAGQPGVHPVAARRRAAAKEPLTHSVQDEAMRGRVAFICAWLAPAAVFGQPADCPTDPPASGETMPLLLDLQGMPGVPRGLGGYVGTNVPLAAPGMACTDQGPANGDAEPPSDVLAGPPGDVLRGEGTGDVLSGRRTPRVEIIDVQ